MASKPAENDVATWIPCAGHSLNLAGKAAPAVQLLWVSSSLTRRFFVIFTASTRRYEMLTDSLKSADSYVCVPNRVTTTRWSCRADASKALAQG